MIHFEKKVMLDQDVTNKAGRKVNGTKIETTFNLLRKRGYVLFNDGEDVMALRSPGYVDGLNYVLVFCLLCGEVG